MIRRRDHDLGNSTETARSGAKLNDERDIDKDEEPDFLDQDDQDQVIRDLEEKIHQQQRQMKKAFAMLCRATAIAAPVLVGVDDLTEPISYPALQRSLRYGQALLSAVLHLVTISLTLSRNGEGVSEGPQKQGTREDREEMDVVQAPDSLQQRRNAHVTAALSLSNILLAAASVALFPNEAAVDKEHSQAWILPTGLLIANAVTLVGAYLLRWDQDDSKRQLGELYGLKYHYKSL